MESEQLIDRLATGLRPVRRMPPPGLQALLWCALAVLVIGLAVAMDGLRHDLAERMALPQEVAQFLASIATGLAAALAAAMLARPDRLVGLGAAAGGAAGALAGRAGLGVLCRPGPHGARGVEDGHKLGLPEIHPAAGHAADGRPVPAAAACRAGTGRCRCCCWAGWPPRPCVRRG